MCLKLYNHNESVTKKLNLSQWNIKSFLCFIIISGAVMSTTPITCAFQENPYVMLRPNHQDLEGNDRYEGFCVDMLKELADILKFKYRIRLVGDGLYGVPGANGTWSGMVGELISRVNKYNVYTKTIKPHISCTCKNSPGISSHFPSCHTFFFSFIIWPLQLTHCIFQKSHGLLVACSLSAPFLKPSELTLTDFTPESVCAAAA